MSADIANPEGNRWYSVKQAAEYLGISEPTVFRWMKEGLISFYKVGGSTRFSQESLDALVEKNTGSKEAEAAKGKCASCGHSTLIEGRIQGGGRLHFQPERTRFWTFEESQVEIRARTCAACGYIQMHADTGKLNRIRQDGEESS